MRAVSGARHVLPAAVAKEAVVAAGHEVGPVLEGDAVGGLQRPPVGENLSRYVTPVCPPPERAVNRIADLYFGQRLGASVRHENRGVAPRQ